MSDVPEPSSDAVRRRMERQGRRDTAPELALRRRLHAAGLRYRVDRRVLKSVRRRHDLVFGPSKVVVEVYGCFWHGCPTHFTGTKANSDLWRDKIATNRRRDADTAARLEEAGWHLEVVWEHEDPDAAASRVERAVRSRR